MKYKFKETRRIRELIIELEALKIVFERTKMPKHIEENIKRESLLKSSLYSARVEGNTLRYEDVQMEAVNYNPVNIKKLEVFNLLSAYNFIKSARSPKNITISYIKKLHTIAMKNVTSNAGSFRTEPWGIFNSAGVAVYLAPMHYKLKELMEDYENALKNSKYHTAVIAGISQFMFEKIHPFADGNGRVGRLISAHIMNKGDFSFRGMVSVEEFVDENRSDYYDALLPSRDTTAFVEFFLDSYIKQAGKVLDRIGAVVSEVPEDHLLPRRREIFEIIKDHPYCSFDFIRRRFLAVNEKTLHYDLKKLMDENFVVKLGKTRGSIYKISKGL